MATTLGTEVCAAADVVEPIPAAPPLVSLFSTVNVDERSEGEWMNGVAWLPEACAEPDTPYWWYAPEGDGVAPSAVTPEPYTKDVAANGDQARFRAFDIFDGVACTTLQWNAEEWEARGRRALLAHQSALVERELWTGTIAQLAGYPNDYLMKSPTQVGGGALGYVRALAELEQAVATVGGGRAAIIHAMPRLVSLWSQNGQIEANASGRQLRTKLGTLVVPGVGYPGAGDGIAVDAATVDASWAYVTGLVEVVLGPIRPLTIEGFGTTADASFDPDVNDFVVRMERAAMYRFDPCLKHGVLVDQTQAH